MRFSATKLLFVLLFQGVGMHLLGADNISVRMEIEAAYQKASQGIMKAKSMEDSEGVRRDLDTPNWVSIYPDKTRHNWEELKVEPASEERR